MIMDIYLLFKIFKHILYLLSDMLRFLGVCEVLAFFNQCFATLAVLILEQTEPNVDQSLIVLFELILPE